MPDISTLDRTGSGGALSAMEQQQVDDFLERKEKERLTHELSQLKDLAAQLENEITSKQSDLQRAERDLFLSLAEMEHEDAASKGKGRPAASGAAGSSSTSIEEHALIDEDTTEEDTAAAEEFLKDLSVEQRAELDKLLAEGADVEEQEKQLKQQLKDKQEELKKLTLFKTATDKGCAEELDLALNLIECVQSAAAVSRSLEKSKEAGGASSNKAAEEQSIIPDEERDTLTSIALHLFKVPFIRDEVLAPYLPLIFRLFPEMAKYSIPTSDLSCEYLLQIAVHPETPIEVALRLAQKLEMEDALLAGIRRPELIPILETEKWGEEHFLILAEASPLHAILLLEKIEDEQLDIDPNMGKLLTQLALAGKEQLAGEEDEDEDLAAGADDDEDQPGEMSLKQGLYSMEDEDDEDGDEDKVDTPLLMKKKMAYLTKMASPTEPVGRPILEEE